MDEKSLGKRLQKARQAADKTQQTLCHEAGLSYSTLAKIERGAIKAPSIFTIQSIASALGMSLDNLLGILPPAPTAVSKQTANNGVRFVYFDVNGCLVRFFQGAFTKLAHDYDVSADAVEAAFWHYNDDVCRGDMTMEEFSVAFSRRLHVGAVASDATIAPRVLIDWAPYYLGAVEPIKEMHELAAWAAEHYRIGLLTNIMPGMVGKLLQQRSLPDLQYDVIVDSSVVGAIKPEKKIYEFATVQAGVHPQEILLVDDDRSNLRAAEHYGWKVLSFDDYRPKESVRRVRDALRSVDDNSTDVALD